MSKAKRSALIGLVLIIAVLSVLNIACSDGGTIDDLPRVGDALKIAEAIDAAVCQSEGGTWSSKYHRCNR